MVVDVATEPDFTAGPPRVLFEAPNAYTGYTRNFDITPDGERFVMVWLDEESSLARPKLNVVLNWFEELKARVPTN